MLFNDPPAPSGGDWVGPPGGAGGSLVFTVFNHLYVSTYLYKTKIVVKPSKNQKEMNKRFLK